MILQKAPRLSIFHFFFIDTVEPNFPVGVGISEAFQEGRWAFKVKVGRTDKGGKWLKGCRSGGQRDTQKHVRDMIRDKMAFKAEINPICGKFRWINAPVL